MFAQTRYLSSSCPQRNSFCYQLTVFLFAVCTLPLVALYPTAHTAAQSAAVSQLIGSENVAEIVQEDAPQAEAAIDQEGTSNYALIMQSGPAEDFIRASISQTGDGHATTIEQSGIEWYATADVSQTGSGNTVSSTQTNAATARAEVLQDGTNNTALLSQTGGFSSVQLQQIGHSNIATLDHVSSDLGEGSDVLQEGHGNSITLVNGGSGASRLAIQQIGADNVAYIDQTLFGNEPPLQADATLSIQGQGNTTIIDQSGSTVSSLTVEQTGDFNLLEIDQEGDEIASFSSVDSHHNSDNIYQHGMLVYTTVERTGTDNSTIIVNQRGFSDDIWIEQTDSDFARAEVTQIDTIGVDASIRQQSVYDSISSVEQRKGAGAATVEQTDTTSSSASVLQAEGILIASIYQSAGTTSSVAEIFQTGSDNTGLIEQTGVRDTEAMILQSGALNQAEILQTGASADHNLAAIVQHGENYSATIHQGGMYNTAQISQM